MMGRTHALSGALVGLLTGPLVGLHTAVEVLPFAAVTAGYALVPDLDHPRATASRSLGVYTGTLSRLLRAVSAWLYARTKGPRAARGDGTHRHFTHTAVFAVLLGAVCWASTQLGGLVAVVAWIGFGLLLAVDRLGMIALVAFAAGALAWIPVVLNGIVGTELAVVSDGLCDWLWIAVSLGCLVHDAGDALTESGCPILWPIPIAGETWYEIRPPAVVRFRTGRAAEQCVVFPALAAGCVLALPGAWTVLTHLVLTAVER
ncbi:metal-dependent hydrolase [Saccharopolyspora sp. NPDC000359]|uniref:metal-dependent hydrolase n=1 Tax=Saccharopolyspora sp. NPDC000359 TaxID=3154251 RepID=UPI003332FEA8